MPTIKPIDIDRVCHHPFKLTMLRKPPVTSGWQRRDERIHARNELEGPVLREWQIFFGTWQSVRRDETARTRTSTRYERRGRRNTDETHYATGRKERKHRHGMDETVVRTWTPPAASTTKQVGGKIYKSVPFLLPPLPHCVSIRPNSVYFVRSIRVTVVVS